LCGEESFGTGSSHTREKDGLWAVLFWLNLLAVRQQSLPQIAAAHWRQFGRHYFQRRDYEIATAAQGDDVVSALRNRIPSLAGQRIGVTTVTVADDFCYRDPVDHSESAHQGIRIILEDGSRIVYRLSGTGTSGATLRVYLEKFERHSDRLDLDLNSVLSPLGDVAAELAGIERITGLAAPSLVV
jgi:phosphoglucomutase